VPPRSVALPEHLRDLAPKSGRLLTALESDPTFGDRRRNMPRVVDDGPGVYAAWLVDQASLRACGIGGSPPAALYVGKAVSKRGLSDRVAQHVHIASLELADLLALQGRVVSPFAARRAARLDEGHRPAYDELTRLTMSQTLQWQHENVRWSWMHCEKVRAAALEEEAIIALKPLLNLSGVLAYPPPQMRRAAPPEKGQAQWLWHLSWAGLLAGDRKGRLSKSERLMWELDDPDSVFDVDGLGYPLPPGAGTVGNAHTAEQTPEGRELWELFRDAGKDAPAAVRHALGRRMKEDELEVWWAAHAAAAWLPEPASVRDALAATLSLTPAAERPGPPRLPSTERCEELFKLTTLLPRIRH
jgi:hypothetical protein